jgi:glycosyltransferase involved in cell wall biosynthesis
VTAADRGDGHTKVSLVATVKDAATEIPEFLASVAAQTRPPDEVVICDGGSTDGTVDLLRAADGIVLIEEPGANIARGRNLAVAAATHDAIAVSDADCVLAPEWLERLVAALDRGAEVAMGSYRALPATFFQDVAAAVAVPEPWELREERFMPSARSVAFRREAFLAGGGYPEWLAIGEDMYLNHAWREAGVRMELVPDAVAFWRARRGLAGHWRQYRNYAEGDAVARMYPRRHAIRFAVYGGLAAALVARRRGALVLAAVGAVAYAGPPLARAVRRIPSPGRRAAAIAAVPALMAFTDAAKMTGYVRGLLARRQPGVAPRA